MIIITLAYNTYSMSYLLEVQEQVIRGQRASSEEVFGHPAGLVVTWSTHVCEYVYEQL
jgi:hypothetical protein